MTTATDLTCRLCGSTPARRGDSVGPGVIGYTCSRCLFLGRVEAESAHAEGAVGVDSGSPKNASAALGIV